jgi:RNase P subunit RPR2
LERAEMVKIVGKDESLVKRITCKRCSSILEYLPADEHIETGRDYGGGSWAIVSIVCPCCNVKVVIRNN